MIASGTNISKVYLGTDHAGFELKEKISVFLMKGGYQVVDCGAYRLDSNDDYPDFIGKVADKVSRDSESRGIVFGGSGQGEAIAANKYPRVRCALFYIPAIPPQEIDITGKLGNDSYEMLRLIREHNDANMLSLSARFLKYYEAEKAVEVFLGARFTGEERHVRRLKKISEIEHKLQIQNY